MKPGGIALIGRTRVDAITWINWIFFLPSHVCKQNFTET